MKRKAQGCVLMLMPPALARIEEEAKRRNIHTDDVVDDLLCSPSFREEFKKVPTPSDLDPYDAVEFYSWLVYEFAMRFLPPSRRELQ